MKTNVTVSVDTEVLKDFKELADKNGIALSRFVNSKMKEFVTEKKEVIK